MATTPITRKGYEALTAELSRLRKEERPKVIEAITAANRLDTCGPQFDHEHFRDWYGDWSEDDPDLVVYRVE